MTFHHEGDQPMPGRPISKTRTARRDATMRKIYAHTGLGFQIARRLELTPQNVSQWKQVPAHHVLAVAAITGMTPEEIRPDVFGNKKRPK
jgi:Bacterial toxin YdaS